MDFDNINFRNLCAEDGIELTPAESKKILKGFNAFREEILMAAEEDPNFYQSICDKTVNEKLEDIKLLEDNEGGKVTLKEYNELLGMIKKVCEIEGLT